MLWILCTLRRWGEYRRYAGFPAGHWRAGAEICDMLVRSAAVDVIIVDLVAALTPRAEIEGDMGDSHVGLQARLMSQALRKMTGNIKQSNTLVIFINQIRMKIGVMFGSRKPQPVVTPSSFTHRCD